MNKVAQLPRNLVTRARLFVIDLEHRKWTVRHREIRWEAGRIHEEMMVRGYERWEAVKAHDAFIRIATNRLYQIDEQKGQPRAPVSNIRRRTA